MDIGSSAGETVRYKIEATETLTYTLFVHAKDSQEALAIAKKYRGDFVQSSEPTMSFGKPIPLGD